VAAEHAHATNLRGVRQVMAWALRRPGARLESSPAGSSNVAPDSAGRETIELIVGLGNPGSRYAGNRHNVGFRTVNLLSRQLGIDVGKHSKVTSVGEGQYHGGRLVLAKPRTFMNDSGAAVRELLRRYHLPAQRMLLIYDDLDLPAGRVRIRASGGSGGQKGMRSILDAAGTQDFPRIRIGIGRPIVGDKPSWDPEVIADWVLSDPPAEARRVLEEAVSRAADAAICCLDEGVTVAMNRFNQG
jgi:PTH1 family peptidyl-tRNA hydrolase